MIDFGNISWVQILVTAVIGMMMGGLWYSMLFARAWEKAMGKTVKQLEKEGRASTLPYLKTAGLHLVMATVIALVVVAFNADSFGEGLEVGLLLGLGLLFAAHAKQILFAGNKPLILINAGYDLLITVVMAVILAVWR